jgi:hypothetical protein
MLLGTFRAGVFGQHRGFRVQEPQSNVLARYIRVVSSLTTVPRVVSSFPAGQV